LNFLSTHLTFYYDRESNNILITKKDPYTGTVIIKARPINKFLGYSTTTDTTLNVGEYSPYVVDMSGIRMILLHTNFSTNNQDTFQKG